MEDLIILAVLGIVLISGCVSQVDTGSRGVITQYVCPDKTIVDNPNNCPKQEEPQYAKPIDVKPVDILQIPQYEDLDCSKPENQNITYVKVEVAMETDNISEYPEYRWYPSLNEGRINSIWFSGYNKGCTKIFVPATVQVYIMKEDKVLFYTEGESIYIVLGGPFYSFPGDLIASTTFETGSIGLVVNERGKYKAIVVVKDSKSGEIVGGNQAEFDM